jgi:fatty-acyl-CoA synthase
MQDFPLTLPHLFRRCEQLFGSKEIVTATKTGTERTTYGKWAERTRRLGGVLDQLDIPPDGRVATFGWNTARHLELYFAAPCSGRVLHTLNIRLFPDQLTYIVNHAEDEVIFCDRSLLALLWPLIDDLKTVKNVIVMDDGEGDVPSDSRVLDYEELLAASDPVELDVQEEQRAAAMCYTSGTTGNPKGVVYTHRSMVLHSMAVTMADAIALCERDVLLPVVPMFHANAWGLAHAAVMCGASIVMPGPDLSPGAIASLIKEHQATVAGAVPTIWMGVLPLVDQGQADLSSLRTIVCGGSAVPRTLMEGYLRHGVVITHAWGMTETSPLASLCRLKSTMEDLSDEDKLAMRLTGSKRASSSPGPPIRSPGTTRPPASCKCGARGSPVTTTGWKGRRIRRPLRTAGCAPAMSRPSPPTDTSGWWTGPKTS